MLDSIIDKVLVEDLAHNEIIAQAELNAGVVNIEGNYYFSLEKVKMDNLVISERIYTCPYRGVSYEIDLQTKQGTIKNVAWIYREPKTGYEHLAGLIGFYARGQASVLKVKTNDDLEDA